MTLEERAEAQNGSMRPRSAARTEPNEYGRTRSGRRNAASSARSSGKTVRRRRRGKPSTSASSERSPRGSPDRPGHHAGVPGERKRRLIRRRPSGRRVDLTLKPCHGTRNRNGFIPTGPVSTQPGSPEPATIKTTPGRPPASPGERPEQLPIKFVPPVKPMPPVEFRRRRRFVPPPNSGKND